MSRLVAGRETPAFPHEPHLLSWDEAGRPSLTCKSPVKRESLASMSFSFLQRPATGHLELGISH